MFKFYIYEATKFGFRDPSFVEFCSFIGTKYNEHTNLSYCHHRVVCKSTRRFTFQVGVGKILKLEGREVAGQGSRWSDGSFVC